MLTELKIHGFRKFEELELRPLRRVNLIVGRNNAGKTSILEAVELLAAQGNAGALLQLLHRRGEYIPVADDEREPRREDRFDFQHLFHGHLWKEGTSFSLECGNQFKKTLRVGVEKYGAGGNGEQLRIFSTGALGEEITGSILALTITYDTGDQSENLRTAQLMIREDGGVEAPYWRYTQSGASASRKIPASVFIATSAPDSFTLRKWWDEVVLTPKQEGVMQTLKLLDPSIEQLAFIGPSSWNSGGAHVRLKDLAGRVPIGTLGEGVYRLLGLALGLANARGGVLLVDEIDTGLHYSVLPKMWEVVLRAARDFDIQVFATTHSLDCLRSLGDVLDAMPDANDLVSVHRVEAGEPRSVAYDAAEIRRAMDHEIEVR